MVSLQDSSGNLIQVTLEQWRNSILPATLRQHSGDPAQLSAVIAAAFQMGLFKEVLESARHLATTDPDPARGACLYALALMNTGRNDDAEGVLRSCLTQHGSDAALLTNLAKIQKSRGDEARSSATLWQAIEADPNYENAMVWWAALAHDQGGKSAQLEAWQRIAALPGSWRAQLQIARVALEARDFPKALDIYQDVMAHVPEPVPSDLLMQLTGDLGAHGEAAQAIELAEPLYSVDAHSPMVGNNLMKAHFELRDYDRARSILNQIRLKSIPGSKQIVDYWDGQLRNH